MNIVYHTEMIPSTINRTYVSLFERHFSPFCCILSCIVCFCSAPVRGADGCDVQEPEMICKGSEQTQVISPDCLLTGLLTTEVIRMRRSFFQSENHIDDGLLPVHRKGYSPYPSATSSAIIRLKPTAKNITPILECSPEDISGISSSTTT